MTMLYPNLFYNKVCYKAIALFLFKLYNLKISAVKELQIN